VGDNNEWEKSFKFWRKDKKIRSYC
jgi:hypothetical protein